MIHIGFGEGLCDCESVDAALFRTLSSMNGLVLVLFVDLETHLCGVMETSGKVPVSD